LKRHAPLNRWTPPPIPHDLAIISQIDIDRTAMILEAVRTAIIELPDTPIVSCYGTSNPSRVEFSRLTFEIAHWIDSHGMACCSINGQAESDRRTGRQTPDRPIVVRLDPVGLDADVHPLGTRALDPKESVPRAMACLERMRDLLEIAADRARRLPVEMIPRLRARLDAIGTLVLEEMRDLENIGVAVVAANHETPLTALLLGSPGLERGRRDVCDDARRTLWSREFPPVMSVMWEPSSQDVVTLRAPKVIVESTPDALETIRRIASLPTT
jgi:hypothetical protein